jgi:hypothetical protein
VNVKGARGGACLVALALSGCSGAVHRYPLRDPVWQDDDLRPVIVPCRADDSDPPKTVCRPENYVSPFVWDVADKTVFRPVSQFFAADVGFESKNVNALDEVPDSSWFTNRIGVRAFSADDVTSGSCGDTKLDPEHAAPGSWVIDLGKPNGANPGFRINVEGVGKFLLKADLAIEGEKATGATAIASRLYHAAGWWTACDSIVYFSPTLLKLSPKLIYSDNSGVEKTFDQQALDKILEGAQSRGDKIRMVASRWLPGRAIGPFTYDGTRSDDPSDVIPHEDRRDLRGARVMAAWLGHFDSREQNSMTTWASADPKDKDASPGHTIHWYLDLGDCFGSHWEWESVNRRIGHSYYFDPGDVALDLVTLGIISRPWDHPGPNPEVPMLDYFHADFDPDEWKGGYPNPAFIRMTEHDAAWAARIITRFSDDLIAAAVDVGDYSDPHASAFLVHALESRRDAIRRRYFAKLSPISDVRPDGDRVCATDLAREAKSWPESQFHYDAALWTGTRLRDDRRIPVEVGADGDVCVTLPRVAPASAIKDDDPARYEVLDVSNGIAKGPLRMHFYDLGPGRGSRLVAIERPEDGDPDF